MEGSDAAARPKDISSGRRDGVLSHNGAGRRTRGQLYREAKRKGIAGRSKSEQGTARAGGRSFAATPAAILPKTCYRPELRSTDMAARSDTVAATSAATATWAPRLRRAVPTA